MSLNLGTEGVNACANLGNSSDFVAFRAALLEVARVQMNQALDLATENSIGYARAVRDLWLAVEAAATNQKIQQVKKPAPVMVGVR